VHPGALMQLLSGSLYSAILCAAAELRVAEALAEGPLFPDEVAGRCGAAPDGMTRLLRALGTLGLVQQLPDGRIGGSEALALLLDEREGSLRPLALLHGEAAIGAAWRRLGDAVKSGRSGFELAHEHKLFEALDGDARLRELFHRALGGPAAWNQAVADALDLVGRALAVDVGAGDGRLLRAVVEKHPGLRGVAFDRPAVVEQHREESLEWVAGDFFESVPEGDAYLLRWVLHDWPDEDALAILRRCAEARRPGGPIFVVENLLDEPGTALLDLTMLTLTGGRERTRADFAKLFERAGLRLERVIPTKAGLKILEVR
jgi:hypothetical protein